MYCTLDDVMKVLPRQQLIELTCDMSGYSISQGLPDSPDETVVADAIRYASERIDMFLRNRYDVPLPGVPTVIRDLAVNLTVGRLYLRRPAKELPKTVEMLFRGTEKTLESIRDGRVTLGLEVGQTSIPEPGQVRVKSRPAVMGGPGGWLEKM